LDWNNSTDCCDWGGVRCDDEGHVIDLYLNLELISGGFNSSSSLFSLQYLQSLDLANNNFNSYIPSGFNKLEQLTRLNLYNCHFYGTLSNSISNLTYLTHLDLSGNDLSGAIPSSLLTLPSLENVFLEYNQFSKLDESFNAFSSISHLDLSNNYLSGPFPISIFQLKSVTVLDLSNNQIQGVLPNWIWKLQNLQDLNISHNFLTELEGPLKDLTSVNIYSVDLHNNQLQGPIPVFADRADYLDYSMNKFSSVIPQDIGIYLSSTAFLSLFHAIICMEVSLIPYAKLQIFTFLIFPSTTFLDQFPHV
jgi:hypothetical protein